MNIPFRYNLSTICLTDIRSALTLLLPLVETGPNWFQLVLTGSSKLQFPHFTKTFHRTIHNKFSLFTIGFYNLQIRVVLWCFCIHFIKVSRTNENSLFGFSGPRKYFMSRNWISATKFLICSRFERKYFLWFWVGR